MLFTIRINVTRKESVPNPEAEEARRRMAAAGYGGIEGITIGKHFEIKLEAFCETAARNAAEQMAIKLLAERQTEDFTIVSVQPH